jgi:hypothetical protein
VVAELVDAELGAIELAAIELGTEDAGTELRIDEAALDATELFKPKKRIASAAFTGKLCVVPCKLMASTWA